MDSEKFVFLDPGRLVDGDLELVLVAKASADATRSYSPAYKFEMRSLATGKKLGNIDLRIGNTTHLVCYGGHIGYGVRPEHRGNRYAARSTQLLFPLAKKHDLNPLWITCNPDNLASRRTCEIAGGTLVEIVDLPKDNDMYRQGDRQKCRYRFDL